AQPFGERSKQNLSRMVFGKNVRVEWDKRDRYDRIVGKVWVNRPGSSRHSAALNLGANRRCHEQQALPGRIQD
ncbi:MAG: thermonuclease family protein, partial [Azonexus sp.]